MAEEVAIELGNKVVELPPNATLRVELAAGCVALTVTSGIAAPATMARPQEPKSWLE